MNVTVLKETAGPHPGWHDYEFMQGGDRWRLRTIARTGDDHSLLFTITDDGHTRASAPLSFPQLLTPATAFLIVQRLSLARQDGAEAGIRTAQQAVRKALGL